MLGHDIVYIMHAKFDHSSCSNSRDMVGAHQNLNNSRDLTTPLSGIICHSWASTCYDQHVYQFLTPLSISTAKIRKAIQYSKNGVVWGS